MRQPFPSTTTPLLAVENLSVHFSLARGLSRGPSRVLKAVQDVSLSVQPGETLGVVGESGCGKTTLGRAILRLVPAAAGKILLEGEDITEMRGKQLRSRRRKIQMIFQDPYGSLNPRMTVEEIVSEAIKIQGGERPSRAGRIAGLLESVGLDAAHARRYPHQFSGGQRQRIGIARALAAQPRVIVCDEPVSALDVSIQAQIVNLLQDVQQRDGIAYVFIAHDLAVVEHISHRIMVMYLGRVAELGPARAVARSPRHPYTRALISAVPAPGERAPTSALSGDVASPLAPPSGCPFHPRCPMAQFPRCSAETPRLQEITRGHWAACHFAK